ncbi:TAXI family TRAP transporter solute-binding subunit [Cardiobacteriales bacterium ML27]|uniref:TAXI family TRAP transporter solute-binding subunit n=2 Tax=Ostreibacterium oceani TaxID=2654998 RepID=A0A6N7EZ04_9GAMM|nr:TAXI family TRAP transporter solute-binding subunit [Ostreibacterium oceani]
MKKTLLSIATTAITMSVAVAQDRSDWPKSISIGTASQGGVYFVYGNGLAGFLGESFGISASGEVTGGPQQNATLVEMGEQTIGLVTMGPMYEAWSGKSELAPGLEHKNVRALFPMYETPFHAIAMSKTDIKSMKDLEGKRISVGPQGGTSSIYWPRYLEALGVNAQINYSGASDAAGQLKDGLIDAFTFSAGIPIGAFSQLSAEADVKTFAFTDEEHAIILEKFPEVAAFTIPGGTYSVQPDDQQSVAMWNFAVAHKDMPESLAYEITKLVMENNDRMKSIHAAAAKTVAENWDKNSFLPYHKGAVKYFAEIGIEIPANLQE